MDMMTKFESMWDAKLGSIGVTKQQSEYKWDDTRPVHWALSRAGPRARKFKKMEVDKMFKVGVLNQLKRNWQLLYYFGQRKTDHYHSSITGV